MDLIALGPRSGRDCTRQELDVGPYIPAERNRLVYSIPAGNVRISSNAERTSGRRISSMRPGDEDLEKGGYVGTSHHPEREILVDRGNREEE